MATKQATKKTKKTGTELAIVGEVLEPLKQPPTADKPLDYWVRWVGQSYSSSVQQVIETGVWLHKLKYQFKDEGLKAVEERVKIPSSTIYKLMAIGAHAVLSDTSFMKNLPLAYTVLYELSHFPPEKLKKRLISGEINPSTDLKGALKFRKEMKGKKEPEPAREAEVEPEESRTRRKSETRWDKFSSELESFLGSLQKEGFTDKEAETIDWFVEQLEGTIRILKGMRIKRPDPMVREHVPPKRGRRKAT